jgi:hypothetical protein
MAASSWISGSEPVGADRGEDQAHSEDGHQQLARADEPGRQAAGQSGQQGCPVRYPQSEDEVGRGEHGLVVCGRVSGEVEEVGGKDEQEAGADGAVGAPLMEEAEQAEGDANPGEGPEEEWGVL